MKTRYIMLIIVLSFAGFVLWSMIDTVCRPCKIPPNAPDNYVCATVCYPEPRWHSGLNDSKIRILYECPHIIEHQMKIYRIVLSFFFSMFLITSISVNYYVHDAFACSCVVPDSPRKEMQRHDAVFSGKVINIEQIQTAAPIPYSTDSMVVTFEIDKIWKGLDSSDSITIHTAQSSASCGYGFENNMEYVVYASFYDDNNNDGQLDVSLCSRTNLLSNASDDIKELSLDLPIDPVFSTIASPLQQFKSGISLNEIQCREPLILMEKHDNSPACVKLETKEKLIERGWSKTQVVIDEPRFVDSTINPDYFVFAFYSQVAKQNEASNVFFSPFSISTAFSIAYEGAKEDTASQMQQVFGFKEEDSKRHQEISDTLSRFNHEEDWYNLQVANALWIKDGYQIKQDYIDTAKTHYFSTVDNVDFVTDDGVNRINDWVKQKTNDKIQDILAPGSTDDLTRMVITNAVYFKGKWGLEFNPNNTVEKPFWTDKDNSVMIPMMKEPAAIYNYAETKDLQALELTYIGGDIP